MNDAQKLLVIGPAWVGDMVMAQSLFKLLLQRTPGLVIDVVGPPWAVPLVSRMSEVRRGIPLAAGHGEPALGRRWSVARQLHAERYAQAIILPRSFKSAIVPFLARIPRRTGYRAELRAALLTDARVLDRSVLDQTVKRLIALGLPAGATLPEPPAPNLRIDESNRASLLERFRLGRAPAVALIPGAAYGPAKQWPVEQFGELARLLATQGFEVWVLGSAGERSLGERIREEAGAEVRNLCGETRLEDVVDLLSGVRAAVTNDSGLMHVAAAAGTRVVALYGSSSPAFTPPLTRRKTIHYLGIGCSPCFRRSCPLGHLRCLREISPQAVLSSLADDVSFRPSMIG
jgi:heptosyltransferase-2